MRKRERERERKKVESKYYIEKEMDERLVGWGPSQYKLSSTLD